MQIAFPLYEGITVLDAVGPYQVLVNLENAEPVFVAEHRGPVQDDGGALGLVATKSFDEVPHPAVVVVPGGLGHVAQTKDGPLHEWLRAVDPSTTWTTSVCTGAIILASAGLLTGRPATTHWLLHDQLARYGAIPLPGRVIVDDQDEHRRYATSAGVSAGIDMALTLAGRLAGDHAAQSSQLSIEYDPHPPYAAGRPDSAPGDVVAEVLAIRPGLIAPATA